MSLLLLAGAVVAVLALGYLAYGSYIARQYRLDDSAVTPAAARNDGIDFVPTRPFYLMGQHFSAIAAAGPIVGPILACTAFGWGPCVLWIVLGVVFIGAVHDFSALVASVRHGAGSIAEIARQHLGRRAFLALVAFIWLSLVYIIVAFTSVTAGTFVGSDPELAALDVGFNRGGAVAAASTMYLLLALVMGLVQRFLRPPMWLSSAVFIPATLGVIGLGTKVSGWLVLPAESWHAAILVYCFAASLLPMWLLQQPRGYLGGFVLYMAIAVGLVGVVFGGFRVEQPAFRPLADYGAWFSRPTGAPGAPRMTDLIFPFLFVTIACGACSGFHGLVCGGTTSKQIAREGHCKPIGFGAMLLEGLVAVIALATVMIVAPGAAKPNPADTYGDGIARFLTVVVGPEHLLFAKTFGTMAVATFVFDTLDVSTRLGRYLLQELLGRRGRWTGVAAAAATAFVPLGILRATPPDSWRPFWTLFGTANQLLASLTLLGITVWLMRTGRRWWYTFVPMLFVMGVTLSALLVQIVGAARVLDTPIKDGKIDPALLNGAVATALFFLAAAFVVEGVFAARRPGAAQPQPRPAPGDVP